MGTTVDTVSAIPQFKIRSKIVSSICYSNKCKITMNKVTFYMTIVFHYTNKLAAN